jgi:hypothetical protein
MVGVFGGVGWLMIYSHRIWCADPDRVPATETTPPEE